MTEQEWTATLQRHREAKMKELEAINRGEIVVTPERYADIEKAALGLFWHPDVVGRIQ